MAQGGILGHVEFDAGIENHVRISGSSTLHV